MFDGTTLPQKISGKKADVFFFDELGHVLDKPPKKPGHCDCSKCAVTQITNYAMPVEEKLLTTKTFQQAKEQMLRQFYERQPVRPEPVKAFKILKDPKSWTKNHLEVRRGEYIMRCIMGALFYKWNNSQIDAANDAHKIAQVLKRKYGLDSMYKDYSRLVANWNDSPGTTHKMVLEVLKEANV